MRKPNPRGLRLPEDSQAPETAAASRADYDAYFDIRRCAVGLGEWTQDCVALERELLEDMQRANLCGAEERRILAGLVVVHRATLERWAIAASEGR